MEDFKRMLNSMSKIRVLENFYSIDYTLLGKKISDIDTGCSICEEYIKEYVSSKAALLSVVREIYELINHNPEKLSKKITESKLMNMAKKSAKIVRINSSNIIRSSKGRKSIRESIKVKVKSGNVNEGEIPSVVESEIKKKAFSIALDNMLIARSLTESKRSGIKKMNSWNGRILEDAYKILRDDLIEAAEQVISTLDLSRNK